MIKKMTQIAMLGTLVIVGIFSLNHSASANEIATYNSDANVEFEENTDITSPVDPTDPNPTEPVVPNPDPEVPGQEIEEGTQGPLSIDYASHLNFGKIKKTGNAASYTAKPISLALADEILKDVAPYVQVTDNRGTNAGWSLSISQADQLTNKETMKELKGAQISLSEGTVTGTTETAGLNSEAVTLKPDGMATTIFGAIAGSNGGTFVN